MSVYELHTDYRQTKNPFCIHLYCILYCIPVILVKKKVVLNKVSNSLQGIPVHCFTVCCVCYPYCTIEIDTRAHTHVHTTG